MKRLLLQLAFVAATGGLAAGALAQQYGSPPSPTPSQAPATPTLDKKTQAEENYRAAQATCQTYTERKRSDCMRDAEEKYNQSFMHGTGVAGGGGMPGSSGPVRAKE